MVGFDYLGIIVSVTNAIGESDGLYLIIKLSEIAACNHDVFLD